MQNMKYHFTPEKGWCNDPNGTIYINGEYHLFYQYYPEDAVWGPMHWGHAVSRDLVEWEHKDIALYPDRNGYAFSGSAIYDNDFMGKGALVLFYTVHNKDTGEQQQCMAYSFDFENFEKVEKPVISNKITDEGYEKDFRDPKLFKNPYKDGYTMALAAGQRIKFYHSDNLYDWTYTGEFNPGEKGLAGLCECPDCYKITLDDEEYWVLTLSIILDDKDIGPDLSKGHYPYNRVMEYFIGQFNGDTFVSAEDIDDKRAKLVKNMFGADTSVKKPLILDYGLENYAMVTFTDFETDGNSVFMIGWGECWEYVNNTEAVNNTKGKMTLPRRAGLVNTPKGIRMAFDMAVDIPHEEFELYDGQSITLMSETGKPLVITLSEGKIFVLRKSSKVTDKMNSFSADRYYDGPCKIKVYCDNDYFEILAEDGLCPFSVCVY